MLDRHVSCALAAGIAANDDDAARAALRRFDPVARVLARRRLERALIDAQLATANRSPAHVMRVAALAIAGKAVAEPEVEAAYAALPAPVRPRVPIWTIVPAAMVLAVAGAIAFAILARPGAKPRSYVRPMPPPSAQAFARGGVPLHDPAIDRVLAGPLTSLVVDAAAATQARRSELAPLIDPMRQPAPLASHGDALANAWRALIDQFATAVLACEGASDAARAGDLLREAGRDVSQRFADAGLGYVIEGRIKDGLAYLQAYRVDEVVFVIVAGAPRRVLTLSRIDALNTAYAALGLHSEGFVDPVIMTERVDEDVATEVIPVLAEDAPYPLAEPEWLDDPAGRRLALAVGKAVRGELDAALGGDAAQAGRIASLLIERRGIMDQWRDSLERRHLAMVRTDQLFLPDGLLDQLASHVPHYQRERVEAIEAELAELDAPRIADRIHQLVVASVRRHEAEHGYDFDREIELRYPQPLEDMLGSPHDDDGNEVPIVHAARAELAGYLSQIANDPVTPHLALWHLARDAFTRGQWGTGEMFAAYVVIEGLARHLAPQLQPAGRGRDRLVPLAAALAAVPGPALRAAAAELWRELYGEPVTTIVDAK
ncbi:MAG TPA: hypothetical protein VLX92_21690 [Kofleriaceae bacterium]|nr:hypothetical protein [Kofleriaceae bacterium]